MTNTPSQAAEDIGDFSAYEVGNAGMEGACPHCGRLIIIGKQAWKTHSHLFDEACYCSRPCAVNDLAAYLAEHFPENFAQQPAA
jgi:hypothetical protein